jgi:hypothetical protein
VKSSDDVDRPQAGGYNSCEAREDSRLRKRPTTSPS